MGSTEARTHAENRIEDLRLEGGIFVEAVRATRMAMAVTDPNLPGNPIVFANQSFLKLSGYSMDEVLGQQPHFMNGADTDPDDVARFEEALRNDQDDLVETIQYRKDGTRFVASVLLSAFKDDKGHTIHHFLSWLDVTRRTNAENRLALLQQAQAALRESETRQAFILTVGDALRDEPIAERKIEIAARLLGERLGASRVLWGEYDWDNNLAYIFNGWFADGAQPFPTVMQLADYDGDVLGQLKAGRTVRVDNVGLLAGEPAYAAIANVGVQALLSPPLLVDGKLKVNLSIHQHEPRHWTDDEVALVEEVAERLWAEVVRARAEEALRASEEKYRSVFETMAQGYCELELIRDDDGRVVDQRYLALNPAYERLTGLSVAEAVGRTARESLPELEAWWEETFDRIARGGEPERIEHQVASLNRWFEVFVYPRGGDRLTVLYADISDRKQAEATLRESERRARTLLAELQHRVRNILAMMRSMVRRAAVNKRDVPDFVDHLQGRIDAMARTQSALTRAPGRGVDLENIVRDELLAFAAREEGVTVKGPQVLLAPKVAEVLTLAIHELAANSLKYGALGADKDVVITWKVTKRCGKTWLEFMWEERGIPIEDVDPAPGFGTELITQRVPYELEGTSVMTFREDGMTATMSFPLTGEQSVLQTDSGPENWKGGL